MASLPFFEVHGQRVERGVDPEGRHHQSSSESFHHGRSALSDDFSFVSLPTLRAQSRDRNPSLVPSSLISSTGTVYRSGPATNRVILCQDRQSITRLRNDVDHIEPDVNASNIGSETQARRRPSPGSVPGRGGCSRSVPFAVVSCIGTGQVPGTGPVPADRRCQTGQVAKSTAAKMWCQSWVDTTHVSATSIHEPRGRDPRHQDLPGTLRDDRGRVEITRGAERLGTQ